MKLEQRMPAGFGEKAALILASALVDQLKIDDSKYIEVNLVRGEVSVGDRTDLLDLNDEHVTKMVQSNKRFVFILIDVGENSVNFAILPLLSAIPTRTSREEPAYRRTARNRAVCDRSSVV